MTTVAKLHKAEQLAKEWGDRDAPKYLRSREAAEERNKAMTFEARIFTERQGTPVHWTVSGDSVGDLWTNAEELLTYLDGNEFSGHAGFGGKEAPAPRPAGKPTTRSQNPPARQGKPASSGVKCDMCGSDTWDNRDSKRSPNGPDYKCKSKECGAAAWIQDDGELYWKD